MFFSPLYRHDPLFRIIRVPQFHKASFFPHVNLRKRATWDLCEVVKVIPGAKILRLDVKKFNKNSAFYMPFCIYYPCVCKWVSDKLKVIEGRKPWPLLSSIPPEAQPQQSPNLPSAEEKGNDPTQTGSAVRWPVVVYTEPGMVCSCLCVCVCGRQRGFGLCWPTSGPATPLF